MAESNSCARNFCDNTDTPAWGSSAFLTLLSDHSGLFFFTYSPVLRSLTAWTDNIDQVLGASAMQLARDGDLFLRCLHPDDRFAALEALEKSIEHKSRYEQTYRWQRMDDASVRWLHCRAAMIDTAEGPELQGFIIDITRQLEERADIALASRLRAFKVMTWQLAHKLASAFQTVSAYSVAISDHATDIAFVRKSCLALSDIGEKAGIAVNRLMEWSALGAASSTAGCTSDFDKLQPTERAPVMGFDLPEILVVDDDLNVLQLIQSMLAGLGYPCLTADNYEDVLETLEDPSNKLRLVLMDAFMPGMNGSALTKLICSTRPEIKVIGITGGGLSAERSLLEAGAVEVLRKPVSPEALRRAVGGIVQIHISA